MQVVLWLYVAGMAGGAILFVAWSRRPRGVPRIEYVIAAVIAVWSGCWYAVLALGGGTARVGDGTFYWARYTDWFVTASLILVALALTGMHALPRTRWGLISWLVAANLLMLTAGLLADIAAGDVARYFLYGVGVLAMVAVFWLIWVPLRATARRQPHRMAAAYQELAVLLTVLWLGYPVIWLLGPAGLAVFGSTIDSTLFAVLSMLSKVGWSVVDLGRLRQLAADGHLHVG